MQRYFRIYSALCKVSFAEMVAFRANFYNTAFGHIIYAVFTVVSIFLLTSKSKVVFGWTREELFILIGSFNIFIGIFRALFTKNLDRFARIIHYGELDQYLLMPVDSQFLLSMRSFNIGAFLRVPVAVCFTVYMLHYAHISVTILDALLFTILLPFSILLLYSIWFTALTIIMWFTNLSNLDSFLDQITSATRYPREMYKDAYWLIFLIFFPIGLIVTVPVKAILHKVDLTEILALNFFAVVFFTISRLFWKYALRSYTSASG